MFLDVFRNQVLLFYAQKTGLGTWAPLSCSHSSTCASVFRGVWSLRSPGRGRHGALFWPEGRCDHGLLGRVWRKRDICKTFKLQRHSPWSGDLPFCPPVAAKKTCKEMQGKHCGHRALAFPTQSPLQDCWPEFQGVCPGKCRTWVCAGELLLGGQRSWM